MAASSPALSNSADNAPSPAPAPAVPTATAAAAFSSLPTTNASKNLRGLNKPKCIKCGNVARSRCPFQSCKSCCAKAQNPCHIHVLKGGSTLPDKIPASGSPVVDQQSTEASHAGSSHRAVSLRQLSTNFAQFNNLQTPLRSRRPLSRKDAQVINEWRFMQLKEYRESNIAAENEAFDRYMQNIGLLEEVFGVNSAEDENNEDGSTEDENEAMMNRVKLQLRSDPVRIENTRKRMQYVIDQGLRKGRKLEAGDNATDSITLPVPGASQPQVPPAPGASQALPASGVSQVSAPGVYQAPNGLNTANAGTSGNQVKAADETNHEVSHGTSDPSNRTQLHQDSSLLYHFREMQRRQVEFIRKRVMLLENAINAEYQRDVVGCGKPHELPGKEMERDTKIVDELSRSVEAAGTEMVDNFPKLIAISPQGISEIACDGEVDRLSVAQLYNKMCKVLSDSGEDSFNAVASQPASLALKRNLLPLEAFFQEMKRVLSSAHQNPGNAPGSELQEDWKPEGGNPSPVPSFLRDGRLHTTEGKHDNFPTGTEFVSEGTSNLRTTESNISHDISPSEIPGEEIKHCSLNGDTDIEMVEKQDDTYVSTTNVVMDIAE